MSKRYLMLCVVVLACAAALWFRFSGQAKETALTPMRPEPPAPALESRPASPDRASAMVASTDEQIIRLQGSEKGRWFSAWRASLSRMNSRELWMLASDPALFNQREAKSLRDDLVSGCMVSSSEREFATPKPGMVDDWCKELAAVGGTDFLRDQMRATAKDVDFLTSAAKSLGPRMLRGTQAERDAERTMIEGVFRDAPDPWILKSSARALWSYQSSLLLDDWSQVNSLSGFQRDRLRLFVQADAACRATGDCDAGSVWLVEMCAFSPGLQCASGSNLDALVAQNLSPLEASILRSVSARISQVHAAAMAQ